MVTVENFNGDDPLKQCEERLGLKEENLDDYLDQSVKKFEEKFEEQLKNDKRGNATSFSFTCAECGKHFASQSVLRIHITGIHLNQGELCKYCEKIVSFSNLRRHIKEKHEKVKKPCPECGKEYGMSNLSHHIRAVHKKENIQCPVKSCGKFFSRSNISTHIKRVHDDLKKVCDICNEELNYSLYSDHRLQRHNLTGKMASVIDDQCTIKSENIEGEEKGIRSLNVGNKMFTFTLE